jgi:hypothetical protein
MKKSLLYLLPLLASSCQKDATVAPNAEKAADEIEVVTQGRSMSCGVAQVLAIDSAQVRQVLGRSTSAPIYLALKLDTALWVRGSRTLYLRIRKPQPSEGVICTANGLWYSPFVVTNARLKPATH